jgi:mono/diheme cytochrome c family protein
MRTAFVVVVVTSLFTSGASAQDAAAIDQGRKVYTAQKCQACHSIGGVGNKNGALDTVGAKLSADEIRAWIVDAPEMTAKTKATRKPVMKAYPNIPKPDLDALVAFLHSLKKS